MIDGSTDRPQERPAPDAQGDAESLRRSEEGFRILVDSVEEYAIFRLDAVGRVLTWNRGAERLKGYRAHEIVGRHFSLLYPPDQAAAGRPDAALATATANGEFEDEGWRVRRDGTQFWANVVITALRDTDGQLIGFAKVTRDLTDRREAEQRVANAYRAEAAALHQADVAKNQFLSRMSHELRTPLNAILGFGQLLQREGPRPDEVDSIDQIMRAGHHLLALINDVLDITRIESGDLRLAIEPIDVAAAVADAVQLLTPLAMARHVIVTYGTLDDDRAYIAADRRRLKQVLVNLLSNAIKYNSDGGTVDVTCTKQPTGRARLSICDGGPGIDADRVDLLFHPFERLDANHSNIEGTGLGLALSRRLVEAMGGNIGVDSVWGEGSTFWIELTSTTQPSPTVVASNATLSATDHIVLYIEDNPSNQKLVESVLSYRPTIALITATSGMAGIDLATRHQPDLVLLDINLPDISGEIVLERLLADPLTSSIPIVIVTADAHEARIKQLQSAGASNYITKPIDVAHFLEIVDEQLDRKPC